MFIIAESNQLYLGDMLFYLVSFLIMAALVWHFAWKPVTQMMQKRAGQGEQEDLPRLQARGGQSVERIQVQVRHRLCC